MAVTNGTAAGPFRDGDHPITVKQPATLPSTIDADRTARPAATIRVVDLCTRGSKLKVAFEDVEYWFHAQWLHDARITGVPSRSAAEAFVVKPAGILIRSANLQGQGPLATVRVEFDDGTETAFPAWWLRTYGPMVAKHQSDGINDHVSPAATGWTTDNLVIAEVPYDYIFPTEKPSVEEAEAISLRIIDLLLYSGGSEIIKITNLPPPDVTMERETKGTLVTKILKQIFGSVFVHSRRGPDLTFNVTSLKAENNPRNKLPNYNTGEVLLPHCDHAHYETPAQVQGLYCLEGESNNTFISSLAVAETMRHEAPELYPYLSRSAMVTGRVAHHYDPPLFQGAVDPAITLKPGFEHDGTIKRIRWHPHLAGSLVAPFEDFHKAREAYQKFQEIMRRPTHQLTTHFKPGDLYIWNNFHTLHGRESVISSPRTSVGQTVPEGVVEDRYRSLQIERLRKVVNADWLVYIPTSQLYDVSKMLQIPA